MDNRSIADRKKHFLEDCCGGAPTMSMGDAGYQSAAPAEGPVAGYDPMLGKKKRKSPVEMGKKLRKEGYKEFKDDDLNDQALKHDKKYRRKLDPGAESLESGKFSAAGDAITGEVAARRNDPKEYKKEKQSQMVANRSKGFMKGKYKKMGEK